MSFQVQGNLATGYPYIPCAAFRVAKTEKQKFLVTMRPNELEAIINIRLNITKEEILKFCQKWKISELSLFGSVLREDFHNNIDVLIVFAPNHSWHLYEYAERVRRDVWSKF